MNFFDAFGNLFWGNTVSKVFDDVSSLSPVASEIDSAIADSSSTSSASTDSSLVDSTRILDMVNALNNIDRENFEASVNAQKELLSLQDQYNSAAAELAWDRYKEYDSNKVQRYVEDMKRAGINPIIAFGSSGMPNITSASPSASSVSPWTSQKASAHGETAIGKYQQLVQGYIGMISSLLETGISSAGNVLSSIIRS